jgi:hypothetical protein
LWKHLESKNLINYSYWQNKGYCPKCGHKDDPNKCDCYNCRKALSSKIINDKKRKSDTIRNYYDFSKLVPYKLEDLSLLEKVYLGTLLRVGLSEDLKYLFIYNLKENPLAPSQELFNEILFSLIGRKIITIHPDTSPDAFSEIENLNNSKVDYNKALFHVNIEAFEFESTVDLFLYPKIDILENKDELLKIWKKIAIEECKKYFQYSLNYVDFPYFVGEKSQLIFEKLIENFSTSQIFGLVNRCLGYTTKEFQASKFTRRNAGAYLLGACQLQGERAIIKKWELTYYFRPKELPESVLSMFFFNRVLNIGEKGFLNIPSLSILI